MTGWTKIYKKLLLVFNKTKDMEKAADRLLALSYALIFSQLPAITLQNIVCVRY